MPETKFAQRTEFLKFDDELGLALGFAIVSKVDGEPYFDSQGDHIPEDAMLKAATDFMVHSRAAKAMHKGDPIGSVVFAWPMTAEIAEAFDIAVTKTGLMIAMKPDAESLEKFRNGEFTGFSIGGFRGEDEEVSE